MKRTIVPLLLGLLLLPAFARADAECAPGAVCRVERTPPNRFEGALRVGFALPFGSFGTKLDAPTPLGGFAPEAVDSDLTSRLAGHVPLQLDLGWRANERLTVGAYFQAGFVVPAHCPTDASCSGQDFRAGVQLFFHILPSSLIDPWVALGAGYDALRLTQSEPSMFGAPAQGMVLLYHGFEYLNVQLGGDFRFGPHVALGPYLAVSIAQFHWLDETVASFHTAGTLDSPSVHAWLMLGVRTVLDY